MKNTDCLTGIRGVAVLFVLFAHLGYCSKVYAYLGMSLFFMLSGTVLSYVWCERFAMDKRKTVLFLSFMWSRLSRLAPLYFVALIPYFFSSGRPSQELKELLPHYLFAIQSWYFDIRHLMTYAFSWSISSEVFLYLIFPFLLFFCMRNKRKAVLQFIIFLLLYSSFICYLTSKGIYFGAGYPPSQTLIDWFIYMSPYGRIIEFSMGIIAGLFLKNGSKVFKYQFHGLIASSIIILLVSYLSLNKDISSPTIALLRMSPLLSLPLFYLMLSLVNGNDITEKFYSNRILTSIGKWSYSIYLLGGFSIPVCGGQWVATEAGIFVKSCTQLFVIIVLSFGSYELIEMPARKYLLKMSPVNLFSK